MLWPFLRYLATTARGASLLDAASVDASLVDPEARIPLMDAGRMLEQVIRATGDPAIGLHAAAYIEAADRDVLEYAAGSCDTLGAALECTARYYRLMTDEARFSLERKRESAVFCRSTSAGGASPPASSDFALISIVHFIRRHATLDESRWTLELEHPAPSYADEYGRCFGGKIAFSAGRNALLFPLELLDSEMRSKNPVLAHAFQLRADQLLAKIEEGDSLAARVRRLTAQHLSSGQLTMEWVGRCLGLSAPTLRRHLEAEQVTFSEIVDEVRRQMAERELEGQRSVSEIAFCLGFSSVSAFDRAFRRWHAMLPTEYRARQATSPG